VDLLEGDEGFSLVTLKAKRPHQCKGTYRHDAFPGAWRAF
jgi:hypothetical protein